MEETYIAFIDSLKVYGENISEEEQAILRIPTIPLTPGFYWIDVSVAQQGIGRLDYIEHAASFTVAEADVYGSGYRTTRYFGLVYLMGDWEIRNKVGG